MRLLAGALALVACGSAPLRAQEKPEIPRFVVVEGDTIRLGDPRDRVARFADAPGDTLVRVPAPLYDDADGVLFHLDVAGTVRRIALMYNETRPITALLEQHQRDFGPPADYASAPVPEGVRETWSWRDRTTISHSRASPRTSRGAARCWC